VNSAHSPTRQRFSLAHELGHALMHLPPNPPAEGDAVVDRPLEVLYRDGLSAKGKDKREIEANSFAAELLMPAALVSPSFLAHLRGQPRRGTDQIIRTLAFECDVSPDAMRFRLVNLGLADPA